MCSSTCALERILVKSLINLHQETVDIDDFAYLETYVQSLSWLRYEYCQIEWGIKTSSVSSCKKTRRRHQILIELSYETVPFVNYSWFLSYESEWKKEKIWDRFCQKYKSRKFLKSEEYTHEQNENRIAVENFPTLQVPRSMSIRYKRTLFDAQNSSGIQGNVFCNRRPVRFITSTLWKNFFTLRLQVSQVRFQCR